MPQAVAYAATAFTAWATGTTSAAVTASFAAGTASFATLSIYAVAYVGISAAVTVGLGAVAQSRLPDVEGQKVTRRQPRPVRVYAVGGDCRLAQAFTLRQQ